MKQTRKFDISDRVFKSNDLLRMANILDKQQPVKGDVKKYLVTFDDKTTIESDSPEVIHNDWLTEHGRRPMRISMSLYNYTQDRRIDVDFSHGDGQYGNEISVSGSDPDWVRSNFLALKEAVEAAQPQDVWIRRHPFLLLNLIALGIGCLGDFLLALLAIILVKILPSPKESWVVWAQGLRLHDYWPLFYLQEWIWRYGAGFLWGAFAVRSWLLAMWPSIEFDFGLQHLQREKIRRRRLAAVFVLIIVPIFASFLYDLIKHFASG